MKKVMKQLIQITMFKKTIFISIIFLGLLFFAAEVEASHVCPSDGSGFVYNFTIEGPDNNEQFSCTSIPVHVDLDINHCFNLPQASYTAYYEGTEFSSGSFSNCNGCLDSDVYFDVPQSLVQSKGQGSKTIQVNINTDDSCGTQSFSESVNVNVNFHVH